MSDYIKREDETGYIKKADAIRIALRESTECVMGDDYTEADSARVGEVISRVIYALQTAPVRHGRWISDSVGVKCTSCGSHDESTSIYCPNCGAKMDGDADD